MNKRLLILKITALGVVIGVLVNLYLAKQEIVASFSSIRVINLQALTSENDSGPCRTSLRGSRSLGSNCDCSDEDEIRDYPLEETYDCAGIGGGTCNPGSVLIYYNCDGSIEQTLDDRSTAYCLSN